MSELFGMWLIALALSVFLVGIFDIDLTLKDKILTVISWMCVFTIIIFGSYFISGGE